MISILKNIKSITGFPLEVFPEEIKNSIHSLSTHHNIPKDFLGTAGLFTIGALAGNIYKTELDTKAIVYVMLIGPSGTGKTPAYKRMCGDIIKPLREAVHEDHLAKMKDWKDRRASSKNDKREFTEAQPSKPVRMMEEATLEAVLKEAEFSPAGQGLVYDEGARMFSGMNQYKKDTSSIDAINEMWNGELIEIYRADSDKNRHIKNPAVSMLVGLQKSRMAKHFNEDVIQSGLPYRFLMCESSYIRLKEEVNYFDGPKKEMCEEWTSLVKGLFLKGIRFGRNDESIKVEFDITGKLEYNRVMREITENQNTYTAEMKKEEVSSLMVASMAKLQAYVSRLALILAIIDDHTRPIIKQQHVEGAYKLYKYFKRNSEKVLSSLFDQSTSGFTESEAQLLDSLPDQFSSKQAEDACKALNLGDKFFLKSFQRKYSKGHIKKIKPGLYEKI